MIVTPLMTVTGSGAPRRGSEGEQNASNSTRLNDMAFPQAERLGATVAGGALLVQAVVGDCDFRPGRRRRLGSLSLPEEVVDRRNQHRDVGNECGVGDACGAILGAPNLELRDGRHVWLSVQVHELGRKACGQQNYVTPF